MDKTLESFLHPKRTPNIKFKLAGFDNEFEMRALTAQEGMDINDFIESRNLKGPAAIVPTIAQALVIPDLRNIELQDAVSQKVGKKLIQPYDVAIALFNEAEISALMGIYNSKFSVKVDFNEDVEIAKN